MVDVINDAPQIGVGLLGYAFMGKAHSNALKTLPYMVYPPPAVPRLAAIAGRNEPALRAAAERYRVCDGVHRLARPGG